MQVQLTKIESAGRILLIRGREVHVPKAPDLEGRVVSLHLPLGHLLACRFVLVLLDSRHRRWRCSGLYRGWRQSGLRLGYQLRRRFFFVGSEMGWLTACGLQVRHTLLELSNPLQQYTDLLRLIAGRGVLSPHRA